MNIFHDADGLTVYNADVLDALPMLPAGSIDAVVTSPPYAMQRASTYGGVPEKEYPDWTVAWMDALKPALKDDGSVIINVSPHIKNGQISDYVLRTRLALREVGWVELMELAWVKKDPIPTGRPDRPRRSMESLLWFGKHGRAYGNPKASGSTSKRGNMQYLGARRGDAWVHNGGMWASGKTSISVARVTDVFHGATNNENFDHPAPFPVALAEWCAKLICPPGGTVLDPFAGSGSTAVAALRNGFQSVAIEREPEYAQMIVDRYSAELSKREEGLFDAA